METKIGQTSNNRARRANFCDKLGQRNSEMFSGGIHIFCAERKLMPTPLSAQCCASNLCSSFWANISLNKSVASSPQLKVDLLNTFSAANECRCNCVGPVAICKLCQY